MMIYLKIKVYFNSRDKFYIVFVYKLPFLFLSYPKPAPAVSKQGSLIGYPESIKKTGLLPNRPAYRQAGYWNDGLTFYFIYRVYIAE
jgi:hypothetical protein